MLKDALIQKGLRQNKKCRHPVMECRHFGWKMPWFKRDCDYFFFLYFEIVIRDKLLKDALIQKGLRLRKSISSGRRSPALMSWKMPWFKRDCDYFFFLYFEIVIRDKLLKDALIQKGLRQNYLMQIWNILIMLLKDALIQKGLRHINLKVYFCCFINLWLKDALIQKGLRQEK